MADTITSTNTPPIISTTQTVPMPEVTQFLLELDALKRVDRKSYVPQTGRLKNSAEHFAFRNDVTYQKIQNTGTDKGH